MVHTTDSPRRSSVKRRGSKPLTVEGTDRYGPLGDRDDPLRDAGDPRREDPRAGLAPYRVRRDAGGRG